MKLVLALGFLAAACGGKPPAITPADPAGGAAYGGETYGMGESSSEARPTPEGTDPEGY